MTDTTEVAEPFAPHWRQRDGQWMVVVLADEAEPGAEIEVVKRDGTIEVVTLDQVGPAERNFGGDLVAFATVVAQPRAASPKQRGLLHVLARAAAEAADADLASRLAAAADDEATTMHDASELIDAAHEAVG